MGTDYHVVGPQLYRKVPMDIKIHIESLYTDSLTSEEKRIIFEAIQNLLDDMDRVYFTAEIISDEP